MAKHVISVAFRIGALFLLLPKLSCSMPSFDHGLFLSSGSAIMPSTFPMEIRGVQGGRRKRYIIERGELSCSRDCKERPICLPNLGEIIRDCKCQRCGTGVPALDGNICQENCPEGITKQQKLLSPLTFDTGQEKNDKGGCCPKDQVPKAKGDGCEIKQDPNDKKGSCPDGQVFDARHGWDPKPSEMRCQIDDEKSCQRPKIPETRPEGKENDSAYKVLCGEPDKDENKRAKCDPKIQYVNVLVDSDGKAIETCKMTRKYQDRKLGKPTNPSFRARIKEKYRQLKPEYDKKNKEREESLKKLRELQAERERGAKEMYDKIKETNDKKKERQAKCSTPIALLMGAAFNQATNSKRDGEHPYDWTTDYFDEEFVSSDDRIKEWPDEVDVNHISEDVDTESYLKKWDEYIDEHRRIGHSCNFVGKRSLDRRCSQKRSFDELDTSFVSESSSSTNSSVVVPDFGHHESRIDHLEKRNPFAALLAILTQFAGRLAVQLTARATASIAANSPRLAALIKNPERLFQIAAKGQGTKAGVKGMDNAKAAIRNDAKRWIQCLKEGVPL